MALNQIFTDNAKSKLDAGINNAVTALTVTTGEGALFPTITGSNFFMATIEETGVGVEIIKVTARTADSFGTIVRAQEGTTAKAFTTAAKIYLAFTTALVTELNNKGGAVHRMIQAVKTDTTTITSTTPVDITGLSKTITPVDATKRIRVEATINVGAVGVTPCFVLQRNGVDIAVGDAAGSRRQVSVASGKSDDANQMQTQTIDFIDNPLSASAITYKIQTYGDTAVTYYINRSVTDTNSNTGVRTISTITLTELSAE